MAHNDRCRDCSRCSTCKGKGKVWGTFGNWTKCRGQGGTPCATRR